MTLLHSLDASTRRTLNGLKDRAVDRKINVLGKRKKNIAAKMEKRVVFGNDDYPRSG